MCQFFNPNFPKYKNLNKHLRDIVYNYPNVYALISTMSPVFFLVLWLIICVGENKTVFLGGGGS